VPPAIETRSTRQPGSLTVSLPRSILLGLASAVLLDFCFPVAGPLPPWRAILSWIALVPLLYAVLSPASVAHPHYLRRAALTAYLCGVLWYILNCYWIYQTMLLYGHIPALGSAGIVVLYSAILGLYFGLFGLLIAFFRRRFGLVTALALAPPLWAALELAASRITSVPWDQLGYSQVDNLWLTRLAPFTGVYGISFVLVAVNALLAAAFVAPARRARLRTAAAGILFAPVLQAGSFVAEAPSATSTYAVLLQPNINVAAEDTDWPGAQWNGQISWIIQQSQKTCTRAFAGVPDSPFRTPADCTLNTPPPGVILWPETASWFLSSDPRTASALATVTTTVHAPFIAGMLGQDAHGTYNSAVFTQADGAIAGRYDKIHLVPFGEYIPYRNLLFFAHKITHQLSDLERGTQRTVFHTDGVRGEPAQGRGRSFGAFICYESVFADEVRLFAKNGAQVLVNLSDDGWYGDTSAPWQHLNMTRMRAIENDRWLLLDTNSGLTTAIDPRGRVTLSARRHTLTSLVVRYGYRSDLTFYTRFGDAFAYLCCLVAIAALVLASLRSRNPVQK